MVEYLKDCLTALNNPIATDEKNPLNKTNINLCNYQIDIFSIENIIVCISEYLGLDCILFINSLEISKDLQYLYSQYTLDSKVEFKKVHYLIDVNDTEKLKQYVNVIDIKFAYEFNKELDGHILPYSIQSFSFSTYLRWNLYDMPNQKIILPGLFPSLTFGP
jgi:hypothetical protein